MRFLSWGAVLCAAIGVLAVSVLIAVWPEPPARPLVGSEGWTTTEQVGRADFREVPPSSRFVRRSLSDKGTVFRTWTPEAGVSPGEVVSPPFRAAPIMSVAITGSTVSSSGDVAVYMTCDAHDERLEIFRGDVLSDITESIVEPGPAWCRGQARLHLESNARYFNVGVGTVAEVSRLNAWKQSAFALFPYLVVAFLVLGGVATLGVVAARALSLGGPAPFIWHANAGAPPSDPRAGWGTYTSQGDAGVGRVSLSVAVAPDAREIAVPLVTGPVAEDVTFRVLGEDGGEIAVLAAPADATEWRLWRIEMAPATRLRQLRIEVEDRGADWGQWGALGASHAIGSLRSAQGHRALSLDDLVASAVGGAQHPAQLIEEPGPSGAPTPAVIAHAPMDLSASIGPGARELVVNFGMRAPSYASSPGTKGVCFSADARLASGAVRQLWRRCLMPVEATGDRGMQEAAIALPEGAQRIIFRTRPAVNGDLTWAWAYWAAPRVR